MPKPDHRSQMARAWLHFHAARKGRGSGVQPRVSTGRSIHAVSSITPLLMEEIEDGACASHRIPRPAEARFIELLKPERRHDGRGACPRGMGCLTRPDSLNSLRRRGDRSLPPPTVSFDHPPNRGVPKCLAVHGPHVAAIFDIPRHPHDCQSRFLRHLCGYVE